MSSPISPISNRRTDAVVPAGMQWDAAEYLDKDGLEADESGLIYFADARNDAWHQLGQQFGRQMTAEELMRESRLGGWNVRKSPIQTITEDGVFEIPNQFATVRTNPSTGASEPLGAVVGNQYTTIQNEENCDVLQFITDETGAVFETAGSLNGGRNVFVTMKLPEAMNVGGVDKLDMNLAALNSHDGASAFQLLVTPTRIVCKNTQTAAIKGAVSRYSIRHTKNAGKRIQQAREALRLTFDYVDAFEAEAEKMIQAQMTVDEFREITSKLWAPPKEDAKTTRSTTMWTARDDKLVELFTTAPTNANIRGTAWAGYQSITEYLDHYSVVRDGGGSKADARAARAITGGYDEVKTGAFARLAAFSA